jgi:Leucine-rich repeat (LRR) protein
MTPLESLTELTELMLHGFYSPDLSFVSGLKNLKKLSINRDRALRSIDPIAGLSQLEELDLSWSSGLGSDYASILLA